MRGRRRAAGVLPRNELRPHAQHHVRVVLPHVEEHLRTAPDKSQSRTPVQLQPAPDASGILTARTTGRGLVRVWCHLLVDDGASRTSRPQVPERQGLCSRVAYVPSLSVSMRNGIPGEIAHLHQQLHVALELRVRGAGLIVGAHLQQRAAPLDRLLRPSHNTFSRQPPRRHLHGALQLQQTAPISAEPKAALPNAQKVLRGSGNVFFYERLLLETGRMSENLPPKRRP